MKNKKEDLRIIKTKEAIYKTFKEMVCEMDYSELSIKELTYRAKINRKTFYLHYKSIDDLFKELQNEIIKDFISQDISYKKRKDIERIIKYFYKYTENISEFNERLLGKGSYSHIGDNINEQIMKHMEKTNKGAFSKNELEDNLVFAYFSAITTILYRQWLKDKKKMPIDKLISTATNLICHGMFYYIK